MLSMLWSGLGEHGLHDYATNPDDHNDRLDVENRTAETPMRADSFMSTAQTKGLSLLKHWECVMPSQL